MTQPAPAKRHTLGPPDDVLGVKQASRDGQTARLLTNSMQRANQSLLIYTGKNEFDAGEASDLLIQLMIGLLLIGADAENQESIRQMEILKECTPAAVMKRAEQIFDQMNINDDDEAMQLELF